MLKYFLLLAILPLILFTISSQESYSQPPFGFWIIAEPNSDTVTINGNTNLILEVVNFVVISPSGNGVVAVDQTSSSDDGNFTVTFKIGQTWTEDGFYEIKVSQNISPNELYILVGYVEVTNGVSSETEVCIGSCYHNTPITITTNKSSYNEGEHIYITGQIQNPTNSTLSISLSSDIDGYIGNIPNITTANNNFSKTMNTGNNTSISTQGTYTLTAHYGTNTSSTTFDYYTLSTEEDYFIPPSSYLHLSDQEIAKWNHQIEQWENAQNRTDTKIDRLYDKLDKAIARNSPDKIEQWTVEIGYSMALSELYQTLIDCLQEQLDSYP